MFLDPPHAILWLYRIWYVNAAGLGAA
jgi:hypothetical protein